MKKEFYMPEHNQASPDDDLFLDQVAAVIQRTGFRQPVLIACHMGHPLTFLGGQLLWLVQPALSFFMPANLVQRLATMLEEPQAIQGLQARLEAGEVRG